jgi:M6 family metalloprotease-like protein
MRRHPAHERRLGTAWLAVLFCVWSASTALAEPVVGALRPLRQPDGTRVWVRIWGDEFYQVVESLDGYTLVRNPQTGIISYADLSPDGGELVSTGVAVEETAPANLGVPQHIRVTPEAVRAQVRAVRAEFEARRWEGAPAWLRDGPRAGPTTGAVQGICLIVDFPDDPATITPQNVSNYYNQVAYTGYGNNGSVRDYFYDVSDGRLTYTNYVPAAYYRAAHPKDYYTDPNVPYGQRARELILEALNDLESHGFDFSQYDADHNGIVDAPNCFYAGYSESAWATGLWPHASTVYFSADGVCTGNYQITDMQDALSLRAFCHENGHMLCGFPDLYDHDQDSAGIGNFCLMAYGASDTNPCEPCAYLKHIGRWSQTILLTVPQTRLPVPAASANRCYKFDRPAHSNEYYLVENRQQTARDAGLPDAGLAIWHIDTLGDNSNNEMTPESHYLVTLVQADGRWDLEHNVNYGDATDLWAALDYTDCTPLTSPDTDWWDGSVSSLVISNISAGATVMTFDFSADSQGGSIVAWGDCGFGQCNVPTPNSGFVALGGGEVHSVALRSDGSIVAWGENHHGQCNVPAPNDDFVALAAGCWHNLGLKANGSIVAWGSNQDPYENSTGQCLVPAPNSGFVAVAAGFWHSLGLNSPPQNLISAVFTRPRDDRDRRLATSV